MAKCVEAFDGSEPGRPVGVTQPSSRACTSGVLISTDPPYYDNIGYSDLSDFFYVWLRRSLRSVHPDLLSTMLVPKAEELVANPYRHDGKDGAKEFFEDGFRRVFARARETALADFPITVYYAFKQSDAGDDGTASTGWETLLDGMIRSGWAITATWPMRSELSNRMLGQGTNALASSIVLALRPRPDDAPTTDRRGLIAALHDELPDALRKLQQGAIAPVDLPQAAIGPGMAVFSRYAKVIENDGTTMTVRSALARINEILDQVLNEQEGDFDAATRFAIAWYRQHGYDDGQVRRRRRPRAGPQHGGRDAWSATASSRARAGKVTLLVAGRPAGGLRRPRRRPRRRLGGAAPPDRVPGARRPAGRRRVPRERAGAPRRRGRHRARQGARVPAVLDRREERLDAGRARVQHRRHGLAGHRRMPRARRRPARGEQAAFDFSRRTDHGALQPRPHRQDVRAARAGARRLHRARRSRREARPRARRGRRSSR